MSEDDEIMHPADDDDAGQQQEVPGLPAAQHPFPFLLLPDPVKEMVVQHLQRPQRAALRQVCKAALYLTDSCTTRLSINPHALLKAGAAARFCRVESLYVRQLDPEYESQYAAGELPDADETEAFRQAIAEMLGGTSWHCVKQLTLRWVLPHTATLLIDGCPNVEVCQFDLQGIMNTEIFNVPYVVHYMCNSLPQLKTLVSCESAPLTDRELLALSHCPALVDLEACLDDCTHQGFAALLSMTRLTRLHVHRGSGQDLPPGVHLDFSGFSGLTRLIWDQAHHGDAPSHDVPDSPEATPEEFQFLRLPASLATLRLQRLPVPAFSLPALTYLNLNQGHLEATGLTRLARGCPALRRLKCFDLVLPEAGDGVPPLAQLQALTVENAVFAAEGATFASLAPQLTSLMLRCQCAFGSAGAEVFVGLAALERLDVGASQWAPWDVVGRGHMLGTNDMPLLAQLPRLEYLRANAVPATVRLLPLLPHLQEVVWVLSAEAHGLFAHSFAGKKPPPQLRRAGIQWFYARETDFFDVEPTSDLMTSIFKLADDVIFWLLQAPSLVHVDWDARDSMTCVSLTPTWLCALAASPSIDSIHVRQSSKLQRDEWSQARSMRGKDRRKLALIFRPWYDGCNIMEDVKDD